MVIEEKFFRLTSVNDYSDKWDLELLYTIRPKDKEPRQEFKNVGYGFKLETAIKRIANYCVSCKHNDVAIKLKDYYKEFQEEYYNITKCIFRDYVQELMELLKNEIRKEISSKKSE